MLKHAAHTTKSSCDDWDFVRFLRHGQIMPDDHSAGGKHGCNRDVPGHRLSILCISVNWGLRFSMAQVDTTLGKRSQRFRGIHGRQRAIERRLNPGLPFYYGRPSERWRSRKVRFLGKFGRTPSCRWDPSAHHTRGPCFFRIGYNLPSRSLSLRRWGEIVSWVDCRRLSSRRHSWSVISSGNDGGSSRT